MLRETEKWDVSLASSGVTTNVFLMIPKQIYGLLSPIDISETDFLGKCQSHWIYKYVYHICVCQTSLSFDIFWRK